MNNLYPLLSLPPAGLLLLCLRGGWKFIKERQHSRETWTKTGGALLALALGTVGMGIMVVTHARAFNTSLFLVMAMGFVNLLRTTMFSNRGRATPDE